jgi:drug/metabolite transporter (DMT)-like permease
MSRHIGWTLALIGVTAIWGWSFVAKHENLATIPASTFNALTFLLAAAVLLPFASAGLRGLSRQDWLAGIGAGLVLFIAFSLQTTGVAYTTPSNAGFITGLCTVFTPLILYLTGKGQPNARQLAGTVIALVGLGFLSLEDFSVHYGDLLVLGCAVGFAAHIVVLSRIDSAAPSQVFAFLQLATVGVLSLVWSLGAGEFDVPTATAPLLTIAALALLSTALAYYIQTKAQAVLPAQKVALILICEPIFSGIFGYFMAGDRFTQAKAIGALLILAGLVFSEWRASAQEAGGEGVRE